MPLLVEPAGLEAAAFGEHAVLEAHALQLVTPEETVPVETVADPRRLVVEHVLGLADQRRPLLSVELAEDLVDHRVELGVRVEAGVVAAAGPEGERGVEAEVGDVAGRLLEVEAD